MLEEPFDISNAVDVWLVGQKVSPTQRKERYVRESFSHPAKMLPELAARLIRTYTKEGELVLDPMSGIGTSGVEAIWQNRNYVGIEVETQYAKLQEESLRLAESQGAEGSWNVYNRDAREGFSAETVDLICFSPPYHDAIHNQGDEIARIKRKIDSGKATPAMLSRFKNWKPESEYAGAGTRSFGYSSNGENIGHQNGDQYWRSMDHIYGKAYDALKPGGYLAVATKEQRDRKTGNLTNLYGDTVAHCQAIGFGLHQHIAAVLCKIHGDGEVIPRTSHWQRMAVKKANESERVVLLNQFEDVAVFRKPLT
ncbi:TRM11 family SAM-dependent methyltransferase [Dietzia timorensis]|uniref:Methyltransferase n=1 Tax=Dietzia timorensis TaxID=499555 RepID=A0A173LIT7_9ACTN|nr:DNA methyltransferase [Dietzia timorensis]ANI91361.1 Modification methylase [Dietzia timorensis]